MRCPTCKRNRHKTSFNKDKSTATGFHWRCRECKRKYTNENYCAEKRKNQNLMQRYKITGSELLLLRKVCRCDLCGKKLSWKPAVHNNIHIDHCHDSHQVRGVLCRGCNTGLGKLGDTATSIKRALTYVQNPPGIYRERKAAG